MYQLSLSEIDLIKSDIKRQRVSYSHLLDDLVDHVCCDIEAEMNSGLTFNQAYSNVKIRIDSNRFKKIQDETIYLIDKNYRTMKTFMKIFGVLSPPLLALGVLFKIQHWPGASILLVLGFFFLCFFFLPSAVYVLYTENKASNKHLLMQLSGLFSSMIFLIGILFKVQHWPGASVLLTVGMVMFALIFLPSLVRARISEDKGEGKKTAYLLGFFAGLFYIAGFLFKLMHWPGAAILILISLILFSGIFLPAYSYASFRDETYVKGRFIFFLVTIMMAVLTISLMSLNVSRNIFDEFVVAEIHMDDVINDLTLKNNNLNRSVITGNSNDKRANEILHKSREIDDWINDLKKELILTVDPENKIAVSGNGIDYKLISKKDEIAIPSEILILNEKSFQLGKMLRDFKNLIISEFGTTQFTKRMDILLDISDKNDKSGDKYSWEQMNFEHRSLMSVLTSLTTIQLHLKLAEMEVLEIIHSAENGTAYNEIPSHSIKN